MGEKKSNDPKYELTVNHNATYQYTNRNVSLSKLCCMLTMLIA